jgi:hypothetical protein
MKKRRAMLGVFVFVVLHIRKTTGHNENFICEDILIYKHYIF